MAVLSKGTTYANGDQVTSGGLNNLVDNATFVSGAVDGVSTQLSSGAIIVKDGGVSTAKLADNAVTTAKITDSNVTTAKIADANVTTAKIADSNVTKAKIEDVANMKVLGNTSGSATAPQEVSILDEDNMASNSATSLATQQSIKAYVDTSIANAPSIPSFGSIQTLSTGSHTATGTGILVLTGTSTAGNLIVTVQLTLGSVVVKDSDNNNASLSFPIQTGDSFTISEINANTFNAYIRYFS